MMNRCRRIQQLSLTPLDPSHRRDRSLHELFMTQDSQTPDTPDQPVPDFLDALDSSELDAQELSAEELEELEELGDMNVEDLLAANEELAGLSAEELISEMADFGLDLPLSRWQELITSSLSSHEAFEAAYAEVSDSSLEDVDFELFELTTYLWRKLSPDVKDLEYFVYGFRALKFTESIDARLAEWRALLDELFEFMRVKDVSSIEELDTVFPEDACFSTYVFNGLSDVLNSESDPKSVQSAVETTQMLIEKGCFEFQYSLAVLHSVIADCLEKQHGKAAAVQYLDECLQKTPTNGDLWIFRSIDCKKPGTDELDLEASVQFLERALTVPGLARKGAVKAHLVGQYRDMGRESDCSRIIALHGPIAVEDFATEIDELSARIDEAHPFRTNPESFLLRDSMDDEYEDDDDDESEDDFDENVEEMIENVTGSALGRLELEEQNALLGYDGQGGADEDEVTTFRHDPGAKVGRNDPCPCNSGKKYKKCCGK